MPCLVGVVQIPLPRLVFLEQGQRAYDNDRENYLAKVFGESKINHDRQEHHLDGVVLECDFQGILAQLRVSHHSLKETLSRGPYPVVSDYNVVYFQGRHRVEAAKAFGDGVWTVRLHTTPNWQYFFIHEVGFIREQTNRFIHETSWCDGDIYAKIRQYEEMGDMNTVNEFLARLGPSKRKSLEYLDSRPKVRQILDALCILPGVRKGLQLGNLYKYFVLGLDDEVETYLGTTLKVLSEITFNRQDLRQYWTLGTVQAVEGRWPSVSLADRNWIREAFRKNEAFDGISDANYRGKIEERVLSTPVMIPSINSFHEYMKYFTIGAQIIHNLLIPEGLVSGPDSTGPPTLRTTLRSIWNQAPPPMVEVSEGVFQTVRGPASFDLVYATLIHAALRQFPNLIYGDKNQPRTDQGNIIHASVNPRCQYLFYKRAYLLGLRNDLILNGISRPEAPFQPLESDEFNEEKFLALVHRRWGRPHTRTFRKIQHVFFLPTFLSCCPSLGNLSVLLVQRDFVNAFLPLYNVQPNLSDSRIDINKSLAGPIFDRLPRIEEEVSFNGSDEEMGGFGGSEHDEVMEDVLAPTNRTQPDVVTEHDTVDHNQSPSQKRHTAKDSFAGTLNDKSNCSTSQSVADLGFAEMSSRSSSSELPASFLMEKYGDSIRWSQSNSSFDQNQNLHILHSQLSGSPALPSFVHAPGHVLQPERLDIERTHESQNSAVPAYLFGFSSSQTSPTHQLIPISDSVTPSTLNGVAELLDLGHQSDAYPSMVIDGRDDNRSMVPPSFLRRTTDISSRWSDVTLDTTTLNTDIQNSPPPMSLLGSRAVSDEQLTNPDVVETLKYLLRRSQMLQVPGSSSPSQRIDPYTGSDSSPTWQLFGRETITSSQSSFPILPGRTAASTANFGGSQGFDDSDVDIL